ncbi:MAG: MlaD family protein [Verrucomicrobiota bacterium]
MKQNEEIATAPAEKKSGFPVFWLVPLLALAISGWLIYSAKSKSGLSIQIVFEDASGLQPGKTDIRYNGVKVGTVRDLEIKKDLTGVIVKADVHQSAVNITREGAEFWIVRPTFSLGGVSGIETLISGNFISVTAGDGEPTTFFKGLESKPPFDPNSPELYIILEGQEMPPVVEGSPILHRGAVVGQVIKTGFDHEKFLAVVEISMREESRYLVHKNSVFWNSSGMDIRFDLNESKIETGALISSLVGSITIGSRRSDMHQAEPASHGDRFKLYSSLESVIQDNREATSKAIKEDKASFGHSFSLDVKKADGVGPGSPVQFRGLTIGEVRTLLWESESNRIEALCTVDKAYGDLLREKTRFFLIYPEIKIKGLSTIHMSSDVFKGPYIDLVAGSGQFHDEFILEYTGHESYRPAQGLRLVLQMSRLGKVSVGSPVYYRGIQVGQIEETRLADDATSVELDTVIYTPYAPLVSEQTRFWNASGIETSISLLGGLRMETTSFDGVLEGAIAFATPEGTGMGVAARDGLVFTVAEKPEKSWLRWKPKISVSPQSVQ